MKTIWKVILALMPEQKIAVPCGAEILCAREQHENICVWFRCDRDAVEREHRLIYIVDTGGIAPDSSEARYLGIASLHGGDLIFNIFEKI